MSLQLLELVSQLNQLLAIDSYKDYCPNGLQIEGRDKVSTIVTGVTASQLLIDAAIAVDADAIIVHHGYFWSGESPVLTGMKGNRVKKLMQHDISLLAYHLPLDAHPELGNNAQLAKLCGFHVIDGLDDPAFPVGNVGRLQSPQTLSDLSRHIQVKLARQPLVVGDASKRISSIAWCTGAAQGYIEKAAAKGVDCFLTGEASEQTVHIARELDVAFIAAGHHATERYGVKALGEHIQRDYALDCHFIDIDNPV